MRICLIYDCLYPYTVGGAERWFRVLAGELAEAGHEVTYVTLRQWERDSEPNVPGVRVVTAGPRLALYTEGGRRRLLPPLVFGAGVLWHLLRRGRRYDAVHTVSFPFFPLLAAAALRRLGRYRLVVDWVEVWTAAYWREYAGGLAGGAGRRVQRLCARLTQQAFCFSELHARRLREEGCRGAITVLRGMYAGSGDTAGETEREQLVVYAGRHIPEKRVPALVRAFARVRAARPELRLEIFGDGPDRPEVERTVVEEGVSEGVVLRGFVERDEVEGALARALCLVLPSRREGYGLVVVEAAARGTPSVVVAGEDNAATELVSEGENGAIAASDSPEDLAAAILRVVEAGPALRESTASWFARNADRLRLGGSVAAVVATYRTGGP